MFNPAYKITINKKVIDTTDEPKASTVVDLTVTLDMDTPADSFTLVFGQVGSFKPARDDEVKIELGYADNGGLTQVISGTVVTVEPGLMTNRVNGYTLADKLLRSFSNKTYESKTAGQIVKDLASAANVDVANAEDGINFPGYVVDGQRSAYHHIRDLAELSGFDSYFNTDGKLVFEKFVSGKTVHIFEYAKHIIKLDVLRSQPRASAVEAWGESPGGSRPDAAWVWLTRDFQNSKGTAGTGEAKLLLERSPLRTIDAARTAANAALTAIQRRTLRGQLLTIGRPEVKLGDAIRLRDMPDDTLDRVFQVRGVIHRITKTGGFMTTIDFQSI
ncbi:MAG: hypothetical protein RMX68_008635 [Aulosira sp. ZfuVER01]|nr:hypothetical protein [Aulosira sp. ZfuVER01]MDZ7997431.1 hypothetical protein [Aulosira sp. DedVER01a]MDZ8054540.1 hypothetical protein [Aulosira sp. ZfuCHP01]